MQGSMKTVAWLAVTLVVALAALVYATTSVAAPTTSARTECASDISYLNHAIKGLKAYTAALKLGIKDRYGPAVVKAKLGLWHFKTVGDSCDSNYWLERKYEIHYGVALVRYSEEMRDGDYDSADSYWESVKYWSDAIRDNSLER